MAPTIESVHHQIINNGRFKLLLLIYILMDTLQKYVTIHLQLIKIDVLKIDLYNKTFLLNETDDLNLSVNMFTGIN